MQIVAGVFRTILILSSIQGFIVGSLLFFSKKKNQSDKLLGTILFLMALACFNLYAGSYMNWFEIGILQSLNSLIPLVVVMPIGPLVYFYVRTMMEPGYKLTKKDRVHFYSVIFDFVPSITTFIFIIALVTGISKNTDGPKWGNFIDTYNVYADIPRWASLTIYLWLSVKYLSRLKEQKTSYNEQRFRWLRQFTTIFLSFQGIWFIYLIPYVIPAYTDKLLNTFSWYPIYIPLGIIIYWLGIKGYTISKIPVPPVKKAPGIFSSLSSNAIDEIEQALLNAMEKDKIYLNPSLNLDIVSSHIGVSQKMISAVVNQRMEKSFNEFINEYRVADFKQKIGEPGMEQFTIAGVAFECGFNSQATFQRTFKEITGMSPTQFRKSAFSPQ